MTLETRTLNGNQAFAAVKRINRYAQVQWVESMDTVHGPMWRAHYRHPDVGMTHVDFTDGYLARNFGPVAMREAA